MAVIGQKIKLKAAKKHHWYSASLAAFAGNKSLQPAVGKLTDQAAGTTAA